MSTENAQKDLASMVNQSVTGHPGYPEFESWCRSQLIHPSNIYFLAWQASRAALPTWQPMDTCPKHVDVLFFNERNGVIPGRLTDADSLMTDKERDEWDGDEEGQFRIDAFGFGHWGVDRMDGLETPSHWMPYPEEPIVASVLGETVSVPKELT